MRTRLFIARYLLDCVQIALLSRMAEPRGTGLALFPQLFSQNNVGTTIFLNIVVKFCGETSERLNLSH